MPGLQFSINICMCSFVISVIVSSILGFFGIKLKKINK